MGHWIGDEPAALMRDFLREVGGCAVIDGGLATELEANGADLNDPLWSAKCLISSPHLIRKVHLDYLKAGANVILRHPIRLLFRVLCRGVLLQKKVKPCCGKVLKLLVKHVNYFMMNSQMDLIYIMKGRNLQF